MLEHGSTGLSIPYMYLFLKGKHPELKNAIETEMKDELDRFKFDNRDSRTFPNKAIFEFGKLKKC